MCELRRNWASASDLMQPPMRAFKLEGSFARMMECGDVRNVAARKKPLSVPRSNHEFFISAGVFDLHFCPFRTPISLHLAFPAERKNFSCELFSVSLEHVFFLMSTAIASVCSQAECTSWSSRNSLQARSK